VTFICCVSILVEPDDGHERPKHVEIIIENKKLFYVALYYDIVLQILQIFTCLSVYLPVRLVAYKISRNARGVILETDTERIT
jgi:hypothetical protein